MARGRRKTEIPVALQASPCPAAPAWLSPVAKAEWRRVAPVLHARGVLGEDGLSQLANYCTCIALAREVEETREQLAAIREARLLAAHLQIGPQRGASAEKADPDGPWVMGDSIRLIG